MEMVNGNSEQTALEQFNSIIDTTETINPTMKLNPKEDSEDIPFKKMEAIIVGYKVIKTGSYGTKGLLNLVDEKEKDFSEKTKENSIFGVFLNKPSITNLKKAYKEDVSNWVGKKVQLTKGKMVGKEMIEIKPLP